MLWHMSIFPSFVKMNNVSLFVCICHILLIHSSLDYCFHVVSLGCFHVLAIMNSDVINMVFSYVIKTMLSIIWGVYPYVRFGASLVAQMVKNLPLMWEIRVQSLGQEDSPQVGNGNPPQYSCLGNPMGRGAWWAIVHGVAKNVT